MTWTTSRSTITRATRYGYATVALARRRCLLGNDVGAGGDEGFELFRGVDGRRICIHADDLLDQTAEYAARAELEEHRRACANE